MGHTDRSGAVLDDGRLDPPVPAGADYVPPPPPVGGRRTCGRTGMSRPRWRSAPVSGADRLVSDALADVLGIRTGSVGAA